MKKLIIWIVATLAFIITIIWVAWFIKFNVSNDDIYVVIDYNNDFLTIKYSWNYFEFNFYINNC